MGIVYNPFTDELYTAIKGEGAFLNGQKIQTSEVKSNSWQFSMSVKLTELYRIKIDMMYN